MMTLSEYEKNPKELWDKRCEEEMARFDAFEKSDDFFRENKEWESQIIPIITGGDKSNICVDAGCGKGRYLSISRKFFKKVIAVDFSEKRIGMVEKLISDNEYTNIEPYCTSLDNMDKIQNNAVDGLYSVAVFMHLPNNIKNEALKEIHRIMSTGGVVVLMENFSIAGASGMYDCPSIIKDVWIMMIKDCGFNRSEEHT